MNKIRVHRSKSDASRGEMEQPSADGLCFSLPTQPDQAAGRCLWPRPRPGRILRRMCNGTFLGGATAQSSRSCGTQAAARFEAPHRAAGGARAASVRRGSHSSWRGPQSRNAHCPPGSPAPTVLTGVGQALAAWQPLPPSPAPPPCGPAPRPGAGRLTVVLEASRTSGPSPLLPSSPDPELSHLPNSPRSSYIYKPAFPASPSPGLGC